MVHRIRYRLFPWGVTFGGVVLVLLEVGSFLLFITALVAGTIVNFTLPYFGPGLAGHNCYFTDALIVYVECRSSRQLGTLLSWAWFWTWGIHLQIGFLPFSLITLIPELVTVWLSTRLLRRILRDPF
ncbi:hypothetical protein [Microvirga lenta]|uniref:hypothetical protein n=1 Tax=Microvirga lenta TaxID=2881337 RepID=UPI001CFFAD32|nr:hypothetical protein [Microvirga lenta]MCB5176740.1 hypothetical protein [Microvirga lenta]